MAAKTTTRGATKKSASKKSAKGKSAKKTARKAPAKKAQVLNVNHPESRANISSEKYDLVRAAILAVVPRSDEGVEFKALPELVENALSMKERRAIGSIGWHVTTVKLDLEARGLIERVPGSTLQRLRRVR